MKLQDIEPNPNQPRKTFDEEKLRELADNIKAVGLKQPLIVRPLPTTGGKYQLVDGERRYRACKLIPSLEDVPVEIRQDIKTEEDAALQSFIINDQRQNYSPQDKEAYIYHLYTTTKLSTRKLAAKLGVHHSAIDHYLEAYRFRQKLPSAYLVGTLPLSHSHLKQTASIKDDRIRIGLIKMLAENKIKSDPETIKDAAKVIREAPEELQEAWASDLFSLEDVRILTEYMADKEYWKTINDLVPLMNEMFFCGIMKDSKKIPMELKKEALTMLEENDYLNHEDVYFHYKEPTEKMIKKHGKEALEALCGWIAFSAKPEVLWKTERLRDKPDQRITVLDFMLDCLHKSLSVQAFEDKIPPYRGDMK
jgi:ParB/RepB/Spo0J family partition protein